MSVQNQLQQCKDQIARLQAEKAGLERKQELWYQKLLETRYSAKHKKCPIGEVDLLGEDFVAEIKIVENFKAAVGQLKCYNTYFQKKKEILFLFGALPVQTKIDAMVSVCRTLKVDLVYLDGSANEMTLHSEELTEKNKKDDDEWLEYREEYIQVDAAGAIPWSILRNHFRAWHDIRYSNKKLSIRGDEARNYFDGKLGTMKSSSLRGANIRGYFGWKLSKGGEEA